MKLRVSLDSLLAAEQVGRWWIVGSSWSGAPMISKQEDTTTKQTPAQGQVEYRSCRRHSIIIAALMFKLGSLEHIWISVRHLLQMCVYP